MNKIKGINKMLTIKESMLIRKCINNYVLENNLEYDKSPLFNDLIHKLKEYEMPQELFKDHPYEKSNYLNIQRNNIKCQRKALNKELKRYSFQTIANKKILELDKLESINNINKRK